MNLSTLASYFYLIRKQSLSLYLGLDFFVCLFVLSPIDPVTATFTL